MLPHFDAAVAAAAHQTHLIAQPRPPTPNPKSIIQIHAGDPVGFLLLRRQIVKSNFHFVFMRLPGAVKAPAPAYAQRLFGPNRARALRNIIHILPIVSNATDRSRTRYGVCCV